MLKIFYTFPELDFSQLSQVYGYDDKTAALVDLYDYLHEDFFTVKGAFYAAWVVQGRYVSVLRMEPYNDGYLIEALQTHPHERRKGYAAKLINAVLSTNAIPTGTAVYAHVHKKNAASLNTHRSCGFEQSLEHAVFIDGSVYQHSCTLMRIK